MGYPMSYSRIIGRNSLSGEYDPIAGQKPVEFDPRPILRGDLRRLEHDQRDDAHIAAYARRAGVTFPQAKQILDDFFGSQDVLWMPAPNEQTVALSETAPSKDDARTYAGYTFNEARACDWTEDFTHENGNYWNRCITCERQFIGHKRRHVCKLCATPSAELPFNRERLGELQVTLHNIAYRIDHVGSFLAVKNGPMHCDVKLALDQIAAALVASSARVAITPQQIHEVYQDEFYRKDKTGKVLAHSTHADLIKAVIKRLLGVEITEPWRHGDERNAVGPSATEETPCRSK